MATDRSQTLTILELLQRTTPFFEERGIEDARLNAELLVAHLLGCKRLDLYLQFDRPIFDEERARLREMVKRRAAGEPLQHIVGTVEFYGREFSSDPRALIPRPETEQLVEKVLGRIRYGGVSTPETQAQAPEEVEDKPTTAEAPEVEAEAETEPAPPRPAPEVTGEGLRILDVGTGSGVIALTLAAELPDARIVALDVSPEALALAIENSRKLGLTKRVDFVEGDLLEAVNGEFTGIVANLPYIPSGQMPGLQKEVRHDPPLALDGGADGLDLIRRVISRAPGRLARGGWIFFEIHEGQGDVVRQILQDNNFEPVIVESDYSGHERFVTAVYNG